GRRQPRPVDGDDGLRIAQRGPRPAAGPPLVQPCGQPGPVHHLVDGAVGDRLPHLDRRVGGPLGGAGAAAVGARLRRLGAVLVTRKLLIAGGILAALVLLVLLASGRGGHAPEVDVAEAVHATLADTTLASGNLVFETQIQLRPEVSGRVAEVLVEEGDEVEQGQLLMYLDRDTFVANLTSAEAGVEAAELALRRLREADADLRRQLQRHEELQARQLVSRDAYDQLGSRRQMSALQAGEAEQALAQQQALRDQAADQLRRSEFRAPIA